MPPEVSLEVVREDRASRVSGTRTPDGFLRTTGVLAKAGVLEYVRADGSVQRELRLPEAAFDEASLATYDRVPLTFNAANPAVHAAMLVTPDNFRQAVAGWIDSPRVDAGLIRANITIADRAALDAVENGIVELSIGYRSTLVPIPGGVHVDAAGAEHRADFLQTNIRVNHGALVRMGRGGPEVRLDASGNQMGEVEHPMNEKELADLRATVQRLETELAASRADAAKHAAEAAVAKADAGAAVARADAAEQQIANGRRVALVQRVTKATKLTAADLTEKTEAQIMRAAVGALAPSVRADAMTDAAVVGAFDVVMASAEASKGQTLRAAASVAEAARPAPRADAAESHNTSDAIKAMQIAARDAWKTK